MEKTALQKYYDITVIAESGTKKEIEIQGE